MLRQVLTPDNTALLNHLLARIAQDVAGMIDAPRLGVVYYDRENKRASWIAAHGLTLDEPAERRLLRSLRDQLAAIKPSGVQPREPIALALDADLPWGDGVAFPLSMPDQVIGLLVLLTPSAAGLRAFTPDVIMPSVALAGKVLENDQLINWRAQNLLTAQSILVTAQMIAESPSPQAVVDILHETLFDERVSSCALLLYGPQHEEDSFAPYEYLEIVGTWSQRLGSGVGTGVKLYLKDYLDLIVQLERQRVLHFPNARVLRQRLDPLTRGFMRAERIRTVTMIALHSSQTNLGVMVIASDKRSSFDERLLRSYRIVSEFLAIGAMAQLLRQQHDRVQQGRAALLDAVTDGVVMTLPGGRGGIVLTVNQRFTRMFEVAETHALGMSLEDLIGAMALPEDIRKELRAAWLTTPISDPAVPKGEFRIVDHGGQPLEIEWYSAPVYQGEQVLGRIYTLHDITAERTAARVRAAFLSRVSHELRTPLTSISGFAEFILESYSTQLPDMAREYTEIILTKARHLKRIFDDMIDLTRADAGELQLSKSEADILDIIIDAVAGMEIQFKAKKQRPIMEVDDDLPPIEVDVDRIMQVLTNLLSNAAKYSPERSTVRISAQPIHSAEMLPSSAPAGVMVPAILITIEDEGKGLSPEHAEQVFQPFYRTEDAKKNKVEGTGLGLAVVRGIVEMHRGRIWACPHREGSKQGGVFMFTLPYMLTDDE
jgi:signal transduction histidine kinase